jgi:hypothetical protein
MQNLKKKQHFTASTAMTDLVIKKKKAYVGTKPRLPAP